KETETDPNKYWREYVKTNFDRVIGETAPSGLIKRVVSSITLPSDTPAHKLERIYDYLQAEIRHTGPFNNGPDNSKTVRTSKPDEVVRRRNGTSREINRLFITMLRAAGIDARLAELTTRDENFFRRTFPDAFQLNSELTAVVRPGGSPEFYDPGTPNC